MDINELKNRAKDEIERILDFDEIEKSFKKYLGKGGEIAQIFDSLKDFSVEEKKVIGKEANILKKEIESFFEQRKEEIKSATKTVKQKGEKIDITRPAKKIQTGHLHPLTLAMDEACSIFETMGFEIAQGPELETEWYNFDALNVPKDHPARDMQDTFWLKDNQKVSTNNKKQITNNKSHRLLMRTQTSPVQIRYMESHQPPLRIIAPGRVFRNEATDANHGAQFYQLEGLMIDREVSASNFKAIVEDFLKRFFKAEVETRLRPGFFPFTEPSFEIDVKRPDGKWMEIMGAGMVHPNVFKAAGLNLSVKSGLGWQGFAFGVGIDRLAILKYKITDIRLLYQNDMRFLEQF